MFVLLQPYPAKARRQTGVATAPCEYFGLRLSVTVVVKATAKKGKPGCKGPQIAFFIAYKY
jgi:hypothetical protein